MVVIPELNYSISWGLGGDINMFFFISGVDMEMKWWHSKTNSLVFGGQKSSLPFDKVNLDYDPSNLSALN